MLAAVAAGALSLTAVATNALGQEAGVQLPTINVEGASESAYGPVQGYIATRSATATKTDTPLWETPQSISVISADQMRDQGAPICSKRCAIRPA